MSTLLLNVTYEPLCIVSTRRAVNLVLADKAEVLSESDLPFSSNSFSMSTPTVIRLKYFVTIPYKSKVTLTRKGVLARDNHICQFTHCNRKAETIDHVHPRSKGGKHEWENVVAACRRCNAKKADKLMTQMNWKLKRPPLVPKGSAWILVGQKIHEDWVPYLPTFE